ncbi:MAG: hypothetical protein INR68_14700 [Methylobacterium mesophilicum]|nr:hypothetical protein [Methylobacterium mesophilicum]
MISPISRNVGAGVLSALLLFATPLAARDLTPEENAALQQTVTRFDRAMRDGDLETIVEVIPPRVLKQIGDRAGLDVASVRAATVQQMRSLMSQVKIESFSLDLPKAEHKELTDGTPYLLVPTETVVAAEGTRTKTISDTLAMLDENKWYLLRVSDANQVGMLRQVYPPFAGVSFPETRTEVLP